MTPEGKVKQSIKKLLDRYGVWYTMPYQAGYTRRGIPDFLGILNGRMLAIEAKAAGGKTTRLQEIEMEKLREQGCVTLVVEGTNTHVLEAWLGEVMEQHAQALQWAATRPRYSGALIETRFSESLVEHFYADEVFGEIPTAEYVGALAAPKSAVCATDSDHDWERTGASVGRMYVYKCAKCGEEEERDYS